MFSLFALLQRHAHTFLFFLFEVVCFILIVNFNQKQRDIFIHSSSLFSGSVSHSFADLRNYFELKKVNHDLLEANARLLRSQLEISEPMRESDTASFSFDVIPARIISQSIHSNRNFITLDKGKNSGIDGTLGLITEEGVVGIVKKSSRRYSTALSLLNTETRISSSIKGANFFGTVRWNGHDITKAVLEGIPVYADVSVGDTVITNGYSTLFPKGVPIGTVSEIAEGKDKTYHRIIIELSNDFYDLDHVYVIRNNFAPERQEVNLE